LDHAKNLVAILLPVGQQEEAARRDLGLHLLKFLESVQKALAAVKMKIDER
jgi:hypothetical protein